MADGPRPARGQLPNCAPTPMRGSAWVRGGQVPAHLPSTAFQLAHAARRPRDAVHAALDLKALRAGIDEPSLVVHSAAASRSAYLQNPDLGRRLRPADVALLAKTRPEAVLVAADGLSATAVQAHAPSLIDELVRRLADWRIAPVVIAQQARVALGDEIGERLGAAMVVVLIGERPGLSAPDSLWRYLSHLGSPHRSARQRAQLRLQHRRSRRPRLCRGGRQDRLADARGAPPRSHRRGAQGGADVSAGRPWRPGWKSRWIVPRPTPEHRQPAKNSTPPIGIPPHPASGARPDPWRRGSR